MGEKMEKKVIVFCVAVGIILVGVVCGIKIFETLSGPNAAIASVAKSGNNQASSLSDAATTRPKRMQTKEFETYQSVEPIPDLVTLMLATPDKK